MKKVIVFLSVVLFTCAMPPGEAQKFKKTESFLGDPIMIDSSSTFIIPEHYQATRNASYSKGEYWDLFYVNIIFYNFKTDSSKALFDHHTLIQSYVLGKTYNPKLTNASRQHLFYRVYDKDYNKNGIIDLQDPAVLYVSDLHGNNLKALTSENENVLSITFYDQQKIAFIKFQGDENNNGNFEYDDKEYYYRKLDLSTLQLGRIIEAGR